MAKATAKSASSAAEPLPDSLPASFEAALTELEGIVKAMESNTSGQQLALEESLAAYQRGMSLLRYCQESLTVAEQKIQVLDNGTLNDFTPAVDE